MRPVNQFFINGGVRFNFYYQRVIDHAVANGVTLPSIEVQHLQNKVFQRLQDEDILFDIQHFYIFASDSPDERFRFIQLGSVQSFTPTVALTPTNSNNLNLLLLENKGIRFSDLGAAVVENQTGALIPWRSNDKTNFSNIFKIYHQGPQGPSNSFSITGGRFGGGTAVLDIFLERANGTFFMEGMGINTFFTRPSGVGRLGTYQVFLDTTSGGFTNYVALQENVKVAENNTSTIPGGSIANTHAYGALWSSGAVNLASRSLDGISYNCFFFTSISATKRAKFIEIMEEYLSQL